jgi:long-chain acyl-CoA synthetase
MKILIENIIKHIESRPDDIAFGVKRKGNWETVSWRLYYQRAHEISDFMKGAGVESGDRVAVWTVNCPAWNIADLGIALTGAVMVSIFPNADEETVKQILLHSQPTVAFVSSPLQRDTIISAVPEMAERVYYLDLTAGLSDRNSGFSRDVTRIADTGHNCPDKVSSIFYTSGTSGVPKAVMHTGESLMMSAEWITKLFHLSQADTALSLLPITFIYERLHNYACQLSGIPVYYAGLASAYRETMKEIKPTFFVAVPQILLQIFHEISRTAEGVKLQEKALHYALNNDPASEIKEGKLPEAPAEFSEIFKCWRSEFGGMLRCFSFGAAAMPENVTRFFWNIGIPALMAYGSNEMSLVSNNVFPGHTCLGSVGVSVNESVRIRILDGEIQVKTPAMMQAYFKDKRLTTSVYTEDGWYRTGDSGEWRAGRFLVITGRRDDLFKASNGRFINPSVIEQKFSGMIEGGHILVFPDKQQRICLLVHDPKDVKMYEQEIRERITAFNNAHPDKQIAGYCLLQSPWSAESGEMTPNMKLRRKYIIEKYLNTLEKNIVYVV